MDTVCKHDKIVRGDGDCYLLTWSIPAASWLKELDAINTMKFEMKNRYYCGILEGFRHRLTFIITTNARNLKCSVSLYLGPGTLLFSNTLKEATREKREPESCLYEYDLMSLSNDSECFKIVNQHPYDTLILTCRIIFSSEAFCSYPVSHPDCASANTVNYMKKLADALENSSKSSLKEKVTLRVGDETEIVSKAVLRARSPVFADMFRRNTGEVVENVVTITNVTMHVLKALVSFLYTGKLSKSDVAWNSDCDVDSLFDLYRAAEKYGITELCHACVDLLLPQISMENIFRVMKFAFQHSDERLKSTVKAMIVVNIKELVQEDDWKDLMNEEPAIAVEAFNFYEY